jgi:phage gp36-like protein
MYCTQEDLENRIGEARVVQLADLDGDGVADEAVVEAAIDKADELIDAYLRSRYIVPFTTVPGVVRDLSVDLALYFLHQARRETIGERDRRSYDDAVTFLKNVSRGLAGIDLGDGAEGATEHNLPQTTTPLADHKPVFRDDEDGDSPLNQY